METLEKIIKSEYKERSFIRLNLKGNPFLPCVEYEKLPVLIGRESQLNEIGRNFLDFLHKKIDFAILGSKGIGKTHFLLVVYNSLRNLEDKYRAGHNVQLVRNTVQFDDFFNSYILTPPEINTILFIDEAEQIWQNRKDNLLKLFESKNVKIISAWNNSSWSFIKKAKIPFIFKPLSIKLDELTEVDIINILITRLDDFLIEKAVYPFTVDALEKLAQASKGIPRTAIYYAEKTLHKTLDKSMRVIDGGIVNDVLLGLGVVSESMFDLTKVQKKVLSQIYQMTTSYRRGITVTELEKELNKSRTATLRQINKLRDLGILESTKKGSKFLYFIKPELLFEVDRSLKSELESDVLVN